MQWQILSGIYSNSGPDFQVSYPVNMVPVPKQTGISTGYLRPADGLVKTADGPGTDRGGIEWNGVCYRVSGQQLIKVAEDGSVTPLGMIPGTDQVTMDYSFDLLCIVADGKAFYSDGFGVTQLTDPDLGTVLSVVWVDGYFMFTDGASLIITDLNNPYSINPLNYGSSEVDPDPVVALRKFRNEVYAVNTHTIEVFDNVATQFFPFQRIDGAQVQRGGIGPQAVCVFIDKVAFVGSARNEALGVYFAENGISNKVSTQEIDKLLTQYTADQLADIKLESVNANGHWFLYMHLPDRTMVYDAQGTEAFQQPVWFTLTSALVGFGQYRARSFVYCYGKWLIADPTSTALGYTTQDVGTAYGEPVRWEFGTIIAYNESAGAQFPSLELVSLPGRVALGANPLVTTEYSFDGVYWSQPHTISAGTVGQRNKRLVWLRQGYMRNYRIQRFKGTSDSHLAVARLEAAIEPLAW